MGDVAQGPSVSVGVAPQAGHRLRRSVQEHLFVYQSCRIPVTVSVGVAVSTRDTPGPEDLIREADEKLYEAKRSGRNRVVV